MAWSLGMRQGGEALACTMAFSALTLARLFHGFNCRSSLLTSYMAGFSAIRAVWRHLCLGAFFWQRFFFVPGLQMFFAASDLMPVQAAAVGMAAFLPTVVIQLGRIFRDAQQ